MCVSGQQLFPTIELDVPTGGPLYLFPSGSSHKERICCTCGRRSGHSARQNECYGMTSTLSMQKRAPDVDAAAWARIGSVLLGHDGVCATLNSSPVKPKNTDMIPTHCYTPLQHSHLPLHAWREIGRCCVCWADDHSRQIWLRQAGMSNVARTFFKALYHHDSIIMVCVHIALHRLAEGWPAHAFYHAQKSSSCSSAGTSCCRLL